MLGSKTEQIIDLLTTQNVMPNWNFSFEYRLINAPGSFQNQNSNHNNYRISSWYQSHNKRYQAFFILVGSKLQASENGGLLNFHDLDSLSFTDRSTTPTVLGTILALASGNHVLYQRLDRYAVYYRHLSAAAAYLALGQKDSIVTDTTVIPLFYPRLRLEHTIAYTTYHYRYSDFASFADDPPYTIGFDLL